MSKTEIDAKVSAGALVLTFTGPDDAKIWRAEEGRIRSARFEMDDRDGKTAVVLRTKTEDEDIHVFNDRARALDALRAISAALMSAEQTAVTVDAPPKKSGGFFKTVMKTFFFFLIVIVLLISLLMIVDGGTSTTSSLPTSDGPVPAEQIFGQ